MDSDADAAAAATPNFKKQGSNAQHSRVGVLGLFFLTSVKVLTTTSRFIKEKKSVLWVRARSPMGLLTQLRWA